MTYAYPRNDNKAPIDSLGKEIKVGDKVVYNLSGGLWVGTVTKLSRTNRNWTMGDIYQHTVTVEDPGGNVSKVKNLNGIVVVNKLPEINRRRHGS